MSPKQFSVLLILIGFPHVNDAPKGTCIGRNFMKDKIDFFFLPFFMIWNTNLLVILMNHILIGFSC